MSTFGTLTGYCSFIHHITADAASCVTDAFIGEHPVFRFVFRGAMFAVFSWWDDVSEEADFRGVISCISIERGFESGQIERCEICVGYEDIRCRSQALKNTRSSSIRKVAADTNSTFSKYLYRSNNGAVLGAHDWGRLFCERGFFASFKRQF